MKWISPAVLILALTPAVLPGATADQPPVAVVNGVAIERWEVDREFQALLPQTSFHRRVEGDRRVELERRAIEALVVKELKRQWAGREGVTIDGESLDRELAQVRSRFADAAAYRAALDERGMTEPGLRRAIERDLFAIAADDRVVAGVPDPGTDDVEQFFEINRAAYMTPESRHVLHALVYVAPSAGTAVWERGEQEAEALAADVREGKTELVAEAERRRPEVPPRYRDQTGDLGLLHRGALQADVDEAVFTADIGEVVGPLRTIFGFSVFEVQAIEPPRQMGFDQVRDAIFSRLKSERRDAALAEFEANLRATATIEWRGQSSAAP